MTAQTSLCFLQNSKFVISDHHVTKLYSTWLIPKTVLDKCRSSGSVQQRLFISRSMLVVFPVSGGPQRSILSEHNTPFNCPRFKFALGSVTCNWILKLFQLHLYKFPKDCICSIIAQLHNLLGDGYPSN